MPGINEITDPTLLYPLLGVEDDDAIKRRVQALRGTPEAAEGQQRLGLAAMMLRGPTSQRLSQAFYGQGSRDLDAYRTSMEREQDQNSALKRSALPLAIGNINSAQTQSNWQKEFDARRQAEQRAYALEVAKERQLAQKDVLDNGQWKVRVDSFGNPLGWYNDRGDYMTLDQTFFPAPGTARDARPPTAAVAESGPVGGGSAGPVGPNAVADAVSRPGGPMQPQPQLDERGRIIRQSRLRALPAEQQNNYMNRQQQLQLLPSTLKQIEKDAGAFGMFSDMSQYIPGQPGTIGEVGQKLIRGLQEQTRSPSELRARAAVYNQAYEVIHALAGSALSTGERQRLEAFLPSPTDPIQKIVANMQQAYITAVKESRAFEQQAGIPVQYQTSDVDSEMFDAPEAPTVQSPAMATGTKSGRNFEAEYGLPGVK